MVNLLNNYKDLNKLSEKELCAYMQELNTKIDSKRQELKAYEIEKELVKKRLDEVVSFKNQTKIKTMKKTGNIDWEWLLDNSDKSRIKKVFRTSMLKNMGLNGQHGLAIGIAKEDSNERLERMTDDLINKIFPHLNVFNKVENDDYVQIEIAQPCSAANDGWYYLCTNKSFSEFLIIHTLYTNKKNTILHKTDNLLDCLKVIRKKYYFCQGKSLA
ncbi:MAG: hypothetical protein ACOCQR_03475 [bacterium]